MSRYRDKTLVILVMSAPCTVVTRVGVAGKTNPSTGTRWRHGPLLELRHALAHGSALWDDEDHQPHFHSPGPLDDQRDSSL
jgi:hypothetical protein